MSQYWDRKLGQIYNYSPAYPNVEPVPVDVESATQAPTACVKVNRQLIPYLAGLCEVYRNPNFFRGDLARRVKSAEIMNDLQAALLNANECDHIGLEGFVMPIGTIFYNVSPTAPDGCLAMDGTVYAVDDYPELAALLPASWGAIYDIGEIGVSGFELPDMNGSYLEAGPVAGDVTGANSKTIPTSALQPHVHSYEEPGTFDLSVVSGGSTPVHISTFAPRVNRTSSTAGGNTPMDFRTSRLTTYAYIVAKNLISENVLDGPTGPTGADGPEGEPGPAGPPGPAADCTECPDPLGGGVGADPPPTGVLFQEEPRICAGARRLAQEIIDEVEQILQLAQAVADGFQITGVPKALFGPTTAFIEMFATYAAPAIQILQSQIDTNLEDELTCEIYCCVLGTGIFNEASFECVKSVYPAFPGDDVIEFLGSLGDVRNLFAYAFNQFGVFNGFVDAYQRGSVNVDNSCLALCDCGCNSGTGATQIPMFNNPAVQFFPNPTYDAVNDLYVWNADQWPVIRVVVNTVQCVSGLFFQWDRGSGFYDVDITVTAGQVEDTDSSGGGGVGDINISFGPQSTSILYIEPGPQFNSGARALRMKANAYVKTVP